MRPLGDRFEDGHIKLVLALTLGIPAEYPILLRLNVWRRSQLIANRLYDFCHDEGLPIQLRLTLTLVIHLVPLLSQRSMKFSILFLKVAESRAGNRINSDAIALQIKNKAIAEVTLATITQIGQGQTYDNQI